MVQVTLGWILIVFPGLMFLVQFISSINFSLAPKIWLAGREAAKKHGFRHEGIKPGTVQEQKLFFVTYVVMAIPGVFVIFSHFGIKSV